MVNAQQKGTFVQNAENQIILPKFVSLLILILLIMKMIILLNTLIVQNPKVQFQKFIANIKIDNVKVKFYIDTGSSANILCYETLSEVSKLNMNNYKLKKTSIKLIPFGSTSQNSFISVKGALSILLDTDILLGTFCKCYVYFIEGNVTDIISGDLAIQLGLLTLHNKATSKVNSQTLSINNIYLGNGSKKKVT